MSDKKRLLLIDDEEPFTRIAKLNLEQSGRYEVQIENDPTRALDVAREFRPDLILLDVIMPEMDGGEVAGKLREDGSLRQVPLIYLTAAVSREELGGEWGEIGGRKFLAKPVSLRSLLEAIEREVGTAG